MSDELFANGYLAACSSEAWRSTWSREGRRCEHATYETMREMGATILKVPCICNGAWRESLWVPRMSVVAKVALG